MYIKTEIKEEIDSVIFYAEINDVIDQTVCGSGRNKLAATKDCKARIKSYISMLETLLSVVEREAKKYEEEES